MEETTEILYGNEEITKRTIEVFNSTEKTIEGCIGKEEVRTHVSHEWHMKGLSELRKRGVKVRVVTQVTEDNLPFCKTYSQAVELRHIDGIQSSFGISDGKWLLDHIVSLDEFPLSHAILTNVTKASPGETSAVRNPLEAIHLCIRSHQKIRGKYST